MSSRPAVVGAPAPDFTVAAVHRDGSIGLADFLGRQPLFLALYRGLHCPFCRRHLAQLDLIAAKLQPLGVATLAVVNTPLDRARFYFRHHHGAVPLGADPDRAVHRAYAVPKIEIVETAGRTQPWPMQTTIEEFLSYRINPTGELDAPVNPLESNDALNAKDGFRMTDADEQVRTQHGTQLVGMFLIDRDGVVRWRYLEGEASPADIGRFPTQQQILDAASALPR
jgi:peroxiredoxin